MQRNQSTAPVQVIARVHVVVVAKQLAIAIAIILASQHVSTLVTMVVQVLATDVNMTVSG